MLWARLSRVATLCLGQIEGAHELEVGAELGAEGDGRKHSNNVASHSEELIKKFYF